MYLAIFACRASLSEEEEEKGDTTDSTERVQLIVHVSNLKKDLRAESLHVGQQLLLNLRSDLGSFLVQKLPQTHLQSTQLLSPIRLILADSSSNSVNKLQRLSSSEICLTLFANYDGALISILFSLIERVLLPLSSSLFERVLFRYLKKMNRLSRQINKKENFQTCRK
jgi:hypothetical protein